MTTFTGWKYKKYFVLITKSEEIKSTKNIKVRCTLCLDGSKELSTAKNSTSNLLKHLKQKHSSVVLEASSEEPPSKQPKLQDCFNATMKPKEILANYIIDDVKPLSTITSSNFSSMISGFCLKAVDLPCKNTVVQHIDKMFEQVSKKLSDSVFLEVDYVCTTADIWSANNKSFLGMTAHWICNKTLKRKKAALACKRFMGNHTYDKIADEIDNIHNSFKLGNKVCATVTDNASNFSKAFRVFQSSPLEDSDDDNSDDEYNFVDINEIFNNVDTDDSILLPPHMRCAAHTLNLISKDMEKFMQSSQHQSIFKNSFSKCAALWNRCKRSTTAAEIVQNLANFRLIVPIETRWNSQFNALKRILQIDATILRNICIQIKLKPLSADEIIFLNNYMDVAKPLAYALNILQGEDNCFLGTLLPVLCTLKRKLIDIKTADVLPDLVNFVIQSIDRRFMENLNDKRCKLASVSHPHFKNLFAMNAVEKQTLKNMLLQEMNKVDIDLICVESSPVKATQTVETFFDFQVSGTESIVENEMNDFFLYCKHVSDLDRYPRVKSIFIKYNTTLPSSAPVERLFSLGGNILTPKRNKLGDERFEKLLMLRYNKEYR